MFAIPIILGNLFMQTYNIVNAAVVGNFLGNEALSAVGAAYPIIFLLMSLVIGIASGGTVLVAQAKASAEAFMGKAIDDAEIARIEKKLRHEMENIVLIGMPGCGKTTVSQALHREVIDTDEEIEKRAGMTIPEIFNTYGENHFRTLETEVLRDIGKLSGKVISTGGGCVTRTENYPLLHQNGMILWLTRDVENLERDGRPLSQNADLQTMYEIRRPLYERFADYCIDNNGTIEDTLTQIKEVLA